MGPDQHHPPTATAAPPSLSSTLRSKAIELAATLDDQANGEILTTLRSIREALEAAAVANAHPTDEALRRELARTQAELEGHREAVSVLAEELTKLRGVFSRSEDDLARRRAARISDVLAAAGGLVD